MKTTHLTISAVFIVVISFKFSAAQNEYLDYRVRDTVSDENFTVFNMNDFRDALVQLGINVYKWNLPIPTDKIYKIWFYYQEYEKEKMIKDTAFYSLDNYTWERGKFVKNLRIITQMPDDSDEFFRVKFSINSGIYEFSKKIKDRSELRPYFLRQFEEAEFELNKKIPLIFYSSGWDEPNITAISRRSCGPNKPPADFNHKMVKESMHYLVVGYFVTEYKK